MRVCDSIRWLTGPVGMHPRLQVSAAVHVRSVVQAEKRALCARGLTRVVDEGFGHPSSSWASDMSGREQRVERSSHVRQEWSPARSLARNRSLPFDQQHQQRRRKQLHSLEVDRTTNTRLHLVYMDTVILDVRSTLDETLMLWTAFSAGFSIVAALSTPLASLDESIPRSSSGTAPVIVSPR